MKSLKIALVVHGRFHAFDLARELLRLGHQVHVYTNYPSWITEKFGVPAASVNSLLWHGALRRWTPCSEAVLNPLFGRWASGKLSKQKWDVVLCWSGVGEEVFKNRSIHARIRICHRGSSHIRTQAKILGDETVRLNQPLDCPSPWMIQREEREYALADKILVLSRFAKDTFVAEGVPEQKLSILALGANVELFRPSLSLIQSRCQQITQGKPLRLLYVGTVSYRKGLLDLSQIASQLPAEQFQIRCVGPIAREARLFVKSLRHRIEFVGHQPQQHLPRWYGWGHIFIFPTLEDGYAMVLDQARAAGLAVMTTTHCAGPDMIENGKNGWVFPVRSATSFVDQIRWCDQHRQELALMTQNIYQNFQSRDWSNVASDFEKFCSEIL